VAPEIANWKVHLKCFLALITLVSCVLSHMAEARSWKPKFENRLSLLPTYYFEDAGAGTTQKASILREEADFKIKPLSNLKFRFAPFIYADPSALSPQDQFVFDINEMNSDWTLGDFELKTGINQIAWGVTDVFNPLDVASARRYTDLLSSDKRGVPSVDLSWEKGAYRIEALYVPVQEKSILPGAKSRWLPRGITYSREAESARLILAPNFEYDYADDRELDDALKNNFGFRIDRHGSGIDLQAIFFQGSSTAPAIYPTKVSGTPISVFPTEIILADHVTLQPTYYIRQTAGVGAVITLESAIIRLAIANSSRVSTLSTLPGWSESAVAGMEKNFAVGESTLTALLQATAAHHEDQADNSVTSLDRIFDQSWLLGLRLATSNPWSFSAAGLYDSYFQGGYIQARAERKISDVFSASIQGDWLDGSEGTPLGTYRRNKRVTLGLSTFF
jgi:hypothetical protein